MKLVYYSSVMNHHQRSLCDAFYQILGDDFSFVETMGMEEQRIKLGYKPDSDAPYIIQSYKSKELYDKAYQAAIEADVFLGGVFPVDILHKRMENNRLTFRHIESYFKRSKLRLLSPRALKIAYSEHTRYRNKPLYLLCASSHVANDVKLFGGYPSKKYKWGYFPACDWEYEFSRIQKETIELLWAGRLIGWKKPEYAIRAVKDLSDLGFDIHLNMLGNGTLEPQMHNLAASLNVTDKISFRGGVSPAEVRNFMKQADIFMFTSTKEEGWGAVLNEAMQSGCAIVASKTAGSTNYLIPDDRFGCTYSKDKYSEMKDQLVYLCSNFETRKKCGENANQRIETLWNYKVAAERFIQVSEALLQQKEYIYTDDGPMSKG